MKYKNTAHGSYHGQYLIASLGGVLIAQATRFPGPNSNLVFDCVVGWGSYIL